MGTTGDRAASHRTVYDWIGRVAVYGAAIVGGWILGTEVVYEEAQHNPWAAAGAVLAAVALPAACIYGVQRYLADRRFLAWRQSHHKSGDYFEWEAKRAEFAPNLQWLPPVVIVIVLVFFGGIAPGTTDHNGIIVYYCEYGAVSQRQFDECRSHVTRDSIDSLDTNAARWARGELAQCLNDAGPFCDPKSFHNQLEVE